MTHHPLDPHRVAHRPGCDRPGWNDTFHAAGIVVHRCQTCGCVATSHYEQELPE